MGKQLIVEEMRIPFPAFPGFDLNRMRLGGDSRGSSPDHVG